MNEKATVAIAAVAMLGVGALSIVLMGESGDAGFRDAALSTRASVDAGTVVDTARSGADDPAAIDKPKERDPWAAKVAKWLVQNRMALRSGERILCDHSNRSWQKAKADLDASMRGRLGATSREAICGQVRDVSLMPGLSRAARDRLVATAGEVLCDAVGRVSLTIDNTGAEPIRLEQLRAGPSGATHFDATVAPGETRTIRFVTDGVFSSGEDRLVVAFGDRLVRYSLCTALLAELDRGRPDSIAALIYTSKSTSIASPMAFTLSPITRGARR